MIGKAVFAVGFVVAAFVVAWFFYVHDHAARTDGGVAASLARVAPGDADASCRERGDGWRCTLGRRTVVVVKDGKKNCWRAPDTELNGCVKVLDFVRGLL